MHFTTRLFVNEMNIKEIQNLLGRKYVETRVIYTHVIGKKDSEARSPLDGL